MPVKLRSYCLCINVARTSLGDTAVCDRNDLHDRPFGNREVRELDLLDLVEALRSRRMQAVMLPIVVIIIFYIEPARSRWLSRYDVQVRRALVDLLF